jgi:hypothetical protein
MSKRKGMSLEEKRMKLLEVFHESADVFVLKVTPNACIELARSQATCKFFK